MVSIITSMAFSRDRWIERFRNRFEGAIGEQVKIHLAELINMPDYWSDEVASLIKDVNDMFDINRIKTKTKFDIYKAAAEAFLEAASSNSQIVSSKNEFLSNYLSSKEDRIDFKKKLRTFQLTSEDMEFEILKKYMPVHEEKILKAIENQLRHT
jgi:hypothetical protein